MSDILAKLFGSANRVKILRLFLLNPEEVFLQRDIAKRTKVPPFVVRKEVVLLSGIGFIHRDKKTIIAPEDSVSSRSKRVKNKKIEGWSFNFSFPLLVPLKRLVLNTAPISRAELLKKINKSGRIKFIALSGIFLQEDNNRVDILIVGDKISKNILERVLREVEAEVGKELDYAVFSTEDFIYRLNIYDKFIRDILDYPHEKILNKLGL